jgi:hypothetical protein
MDSPDMDFCHDCYEKQKRYYTNTEKPFCFKCCCWGEH